MLSIKIFDILGYGTNIEHGVMKIMHDAKIIGIKV